jgi:ribosomal protein S12 methylthiotransferase
VDRGEIRQRQGGAVRIVRRPVQGERVFLMRQRIVEMAAPPVQHAQIGLGERRVEPVTAGIREPGELFGERLAARVVALRQCDVDAPCDRVGEAGDIAAPASERGGALPLAVRGRLRADGRKEVAGDPCGPAVRRSASERVHDPRRRGRFEQVVDCLRDAQRRCRGGRARVRVGVRGERAHARRGGRDEQPRSHARPGAPVFRRLASVLHGIPQGRSVRPMSWRLTYDARFSACVGVRTARHRGPAAAGAPRVDYRASRFRPPMPPRNPKVGFVSLGCPKALVDSERILTQLRVEGYDIVPSYGAADVVVVNTCGFIDAAVTESLDAIGEALEENGKVIVTGCLGKRAELIREAHPDVLSISGPQDYASVMKAVHAALPPKHDPFMDLVPPQGIKLTPKHYAYLKISEGCNHRCTFCIIPSMRGDLVSRPIDEVLIEAEKLVKGGVRELLVVSQDTSAYGVDLKYAEREWRGNAYATRMTDLCRGLADLGAWVRLHYVYPYPHVDDVIPLMAEGKVLPYLDIPFQHASPEVLKAMKRPANEAKVLERIRAWRAIAPELTIRSSFVVGFPGETEAEFEDLLDFLREAELDRVGAFAYSPVDGARANALPDPIPEEIRQERLERFMEVQADISAARLERKLGTRQTVIVDEVDADGAIARSKADAPEIDGIVRIDDGQKLRPGQFAEVTVVHADEHDLIARLQV